MRKVKGQKELEMEQVKALELDIFRQIVKTCEHHKLRYIVDYGSLIGAVRHGGFIPWDDDIDISMPRPDYERFRRIFVKELPKNSEFELRTGMDANLALPYIQVVNKNTITVKKGRRPAFAQAVWVDIFPVDGAGDGGKEKEEIYQKYWEKITYSRKLIGRYRPYLNPWKQIRQFYYHYLLKFRLKKEILEAERIMKQLDYEESKEVFCYCTVYGEKEKNSKRYYDERIDARFEGILCKIPKDYDEKLRGIYGDYQKLPPEEKRTGHDFRAFWLKK